jgi:hypothetical protein
LIHENPIDSIVRDCAFLRNNPHESFTISVAIGGGLTIKGCCFSGNRQKEVREWHVVLSDCSFDQAGCETQISWGSLGIRPGQTDAITENARASEIDNRRIDIVRVSAGFAMVSAGLLTGIQFALKRWWKSRKGVQALR